MIHLTRNCLIGILNFEGKQHTALSFLDDKWKERNPDGSCGPWLCGAYTKDPHHGYIECDAKCLFEGFPFTPMHLNSVVKIDCPNCIKIMKEHGL